MVSDTNYSRGGLVRGLGLLQATALNVANMIGVGPFITIPAFLATMGGPQAMLAWVVAAVLVICDGLVWSELGAALPGSGGTYHFFKEIFGGHRVLRVLPFLFIWQFLISGTLELASGYIGMMNYLKYIFPRLKESGTLEAGLLGTVLSMLVTLILCRRIHVVGWLSVALCAGTLLTVAVVIVAGLAHFDASLLRFPEGAFRLDATFIRGLGGAMTIAVYDYLGYYNVCHLGEEVREPGKNIPRAVIISVVLVSAIYLTMNVSIIAVVPWEVAMKSENIAALFMEKLFGRPTAVLFTWMILWTAFACVFVMTLGYSRIPFAAARGGDFFRPFAWLHPRGAYPAASLVAIGFGTALFSFFDLADVINAAVVVRVGVQFIGQIAALHVLRTRRPELRLPFRMWLYPLPSLAALLGWVFILATSQGLLLAAAAGVVASGYGAYALWQWVRRGPSPGAVRS